MMRRIFLVLTKPKIPLAFFALLLCHATVFAVGPDDVVVLPLNEGSGTVAGDVSGMGNNGTLVNGPLYESSTGDGSAFAVRFDGTDDRIDLGSVDVNGTGLTLAAWFNGDSFPGPSNDPRLISKASGVQANDHVFMLSTIQASGQIRLRARVRVGGATTTLIASSGDIFAGMWYHAAVTYDGTTLRLFLNATEVGSAPLSGTVDVAPAIEVAIGSQPLGAANFFDGLLDDVRILQRAMSQSELITIVNGTTENQPPVAVNDDYQTAINTPVVASAGNGVLQNDVDPDLDPLRAILASDVSNGTLTLNVDGSFGYTPDNGFTGFDTFTYRAHDTPVVPDKPINPDLHEDFHRANGFVGGPDLAASNLATVTITVQQPVTVVNDSYFTGQDVTLVISVASGVLANDTDNNPPDDLTATLLTNPTDGMLTNFSSDGSFTYVPDPGFNGPDSFTYEAVEGGSGATAQATVNLTVTPIGVTNEPPHIVTGEPAFTQQTIAVNVNETHFVVAADLDGDDDNDVVTTDFIDDSVFWYENDGNGGFTMRVLDGNLDGAYPADIADVDLDGDNDVLAGGYVADTYAWYENNGTGSFTRHDIDTAINGAHSIVTADMEGDGDIDLLTANQDASTITWYENDGNENFTIHTIDGSALGAKRAEFADFDGDNDMDVVAAINFDRVVAWYENNGSESFTKRVIDNTVNGAYYVFPAELNGGGIDILSASQHDHTIAMYSNNGNGTFSGQNLDTGANGARTVLAVDIDNDGDLDPIAASVDDDTVAWFENDGGGGFTKHEIDIGANGAYGIFGADMDQDGDVDVLSANRDANNVVIHFQHQAHQAQLGAAGGTLVITTALLQTTDVDDGPTQLTYTLTDAPDSGELRLDGAMVSQGGTFTQDAINNNRVSYVHDGSPATVDGFSFDVADGGEAGVKPASGTFAISIQAAATAEADKAASAIPVTYALHKNFPNPFNPTTTIHYQLPRTTDLTLEIFDVSGRLVRQLIDGRQTAGDRRVLWDARDDRGTRVTSGVYFVLLRTPEFRQTIKMTLLE